MALRVPPLRSPVVLLVDEERSSARAATDTYVLGIAFLLVLLATTLDVPNLLDRGNALRYALLLVPIGALVVIRLRAPSSFIRRPEPTDVLLFGLWGIGLVGTVYGMSVKGTTATAFAVFLPMSLAFLYLGTMQTITDQEARTLLRLVATAGSVYICLNALVNGGLIPGVDANQYRNASLIFTALGFGATIILRRWLRLFVLLGLEAFVLVTYPSGTSVLVAIAIAITFAMTAPRPSSVRPYVIAGLVLAAVTVVAVNFSAGVAATSDYFALVNKNDSSTTRLRAWQDGIARFESSPVIGSGFSEAGVTTVTRPGGRGRFQIPFHNDYVFFLAGGGIIGFGLLVAWVVGTELIVLRRYGRLIASGRNAHAALLRALLVGFNAFFVTAGFNPSMMGMSRSASVFAVYALMMGVGAAAWRPPA
jgi:O-antigen ligase